ncbi:MAG: leucyl/phenylalanyl-tRNA--protein transferase [Colwellia sp.]
MRQILYQLDEHNLAFPAIEFALTDPNGLLALGGDLQPQRLLNAYHQGIFPWFSENDPLMWWSPNPRTIIKFDDLKINRSLRKALNKSPYKITLNKSFKQVIQFCANAPFRDDETWILPSMQAAYLSLHELGHAHSIEVWHTEENEDKLVGGLYGVAINGYFSGESMFYTRSNASKFALIALAKLLKSINVDFIDCQLINPFLADMGATEISRAEFVELKKTAISTTIAANFWQARELI